ncbi:hypothetical protein [Bacteroides sp. GM023]|uniref:hypothetical protein n=1 Tax=Bacteroides sp. GM023 TaxID=2723058 RepID=UPI00168AC097|nr:hypothetical protein [Bacteroides sp. GM023]MBD3589538.1 hypothetical protein [Bacteroides sp. GM023]
MKIHYFYRREYSEGFYNLEIVAWLEEEETSKQGTERLSFTQLEKLRIFLSKSVDYHVHTINHDFGNDSCYGHFAHTRKELIADMKKWGCKPITRHNYERFRKVALALYHKQSLVDFSNFKGKQKYAIRQIIGD